VITTPPDIVIEIVSPSPRDGRRDRIDKLTDYAAFGVRYYWILDPQLRSLEILELGPHGRYTHALGASAGVLDRIPGCEGLTLDLDGFWSEIDRVIQAQESG
jgi:Uma2 family endonuclease